MRRINSICLSALLVLCTGLAPGDLWAQEGHRPEMIAPGKITTGALEYRRYCAPCHGPNGKGDGPVAAVLKTQPPDLTQITKGHAGKFPEDYVLSYIDGTHMIPAHGNSEMPIWGNEFAKGGPGLSKRTQHEVDTRIRLLVEYIKSIQEQL
jgi:mono/diheme cytochrome c family protein